MKTITKLLIISFLAISFILLFQATNPLYAEAGNVSCSEGNCWYVQCRQNSDCGTNSWTGSKTCNGNDIYQNYITYTCNGAGTATAYCTSSITSKYQISCSLTEQICKYGFCMNAGSNSGTSPTPAPTPSPSPASNQITCYSRYYTQCVGNSIYWFDSCGNSQDIYYACASDKICSGNACITIYKVHNTKSCVGNTSYWYDSLGNQKDVYKSCGLTGQTCQSGLCVGQESLSQSVPTPQPAPAPESTSAYSSRYETKCYNNDAYWYDSKGALQDLYKSCSDGNQCTADVCDNSQCQNTLKCDGSTCVVGSDDYIKYCTSVAAVSQNPENLLISFFKKWYIWLIIAIVLIFLFVIVFRRLSSNV